MDSPTTKQYIKRGQSVSLQEIINQAYYAGPFELLVLRNGRAGDIVEQLRPKLNLEPTGTGRLRLFEVNNYKIHKVFGDDDYISTISDFSTVYCEEVTAEELAAAENDQFVNIMHFNKEVVRSHGIPFRFLIKHDEPFSATKERLIARLGVSEKEAPKVKFFFIAGDILSDIEIGPNDLLGIDHIDKSGKSSRLGGVERAIKIF
ncbi:hypothetical protein HK405_004932, partial [Cladochytrium tenue]